MWRENIIKEQGKTEIDKEKQKRKEHKRDDKRIMKKKIGIKEECNKIQE